MSLASLSMHGMASGPGFWFLVGSLLSSTATVFMVFYNAVKATPDSLPSVDNKVEWIRSQENSLSKEAYKDFLTQQVIGSLRHSDEFDPTKLTRLDRHRMLQVALEVNKTRNSETLEDMQRLNQHISKGRGRGERQAFGDNDMAEITENEQAVLAMDTTPFQLALDICNDQSEKGKLASKVPPKILDLAFQSIDVDRTGTLDLNEFRVALKMCGVPSTRAAVDQVLATIDEDHNGSLDIEEFGKFFNEIQDMLRCEADLRSEEMLNAFLCRFCLIANIAGICLLTYLVVQGEASLMIDIAFPSIGITTTLFCTCVIGLPLVRVIFGNQPIIWKQLVNRHCSDVWQHFLTGPFGQILRLLGKCCRSCCRRRGQEPEDQVTGSGSESPMQGRVIAWAEGDHKASQSRSRSKSSQPARRGHTLDTRLEEATHISDIEAPASSDPDSPASSRTGSKRALSKRSSHSHSSSKSQASKESTSTPTLSGESTSPRKTRGTRKTRKGMSVKKSMQSRATLGGDSTQESNWLPSFLRSNKDKPRQRSRSSVRRQSVQRSILDATYEPGHFAQAAERAASSRGQPVGSFSPMQVRDLRLPPRAEPEVFIL